MQIIGKVHLIGQTESVGANGFTKRQIVIATDEQYVQHVPIDFVKDKCSILDNYKVGQEVTVDVNVRGNEYNGKYYVNLQGWKINANTTAQPQQKPQTPAPLAQDAEDGDLPF
jgi:YbbR domain-containing protein